MSDSALINKWLDGSPYSFPEDDVGEFAAGALLQEQLRISQRQQMIQTEFQKMAQDIRHELERDFDVRLVYESNAIEGVETTFPQTREMLGTLSNNKSVSAFTFRQQIIEDKKLLEVVGHAQALQFVREVASSLYDRTLREIDIRSIHRLAMASEPRIAGHYKTTDNQIAGREGDLLTARSDDVGHHMHQLVEWLNQTNIHGPLVATVVHAWLANIHPFEDGNGRVARLIANYVLYRNAWPCLILRAGAEREEYYDALKHSDAGGDILPLFSLFVKSLDRSLTEMSDPELARSIIQADLQRTDEFEAWSRLHTGFTARLSQAVTASGLQFEVVGHLQPPDFLYLKRRDATGNGWFAKVRSPDRHLDLLLWFGYQSAELRQSVPQGAPTAPSIFISERDPAPMPLHPYRPLWNDERLRVHEVSLQVVAGRDRLLLRQAGHVSSRPITDGVEEFASTLAAHRCGEAIA